MVMVLRRMERAITVALRNVLEKGIGKNTQNFFDMLGLEETGYRPAKEN